MTTEERLKKMEKGFLRAKLFNMVRPRGKAMKLITAMLLVAAVCTCLGCEKKDKVPPPPRTATRPADPVRAAIKYPQGFPCSDGTIYVVDELSHSGKVLWLVNGKAVEITIEDSLDVFARKPMIGFAGGVYIAGKEHLWYLKAGSAKQVAFVDATAIKPDEHEVTTQSVNWAALSAYGREQFAKGLEEGKKADK